MGNLLLNEGKKGSNTFEDFKANYSASGYFDSLDFPKQNSQIWYQKENKDNRIMVITHWLQSKFLR